MAVELATAYVSIVPSAKGFGKALESELGSSGSSAGDAASASFGSKFTGGMAGIGKAAGVGLGVALVGAAGIGKALYDMGATFDDASDRIRVGTGKTGEALTQLEDDFKAVATSVPASFDDASIAVTTLSQRLGLAGPDLTRLAEQMLELSRVTDTDLVTNLEGITRVFGDWGIGADEQTGFVDKMYRATQASGIAFDQLSTSVVQFGAPLRNLGFGFDQSIALLAQFEKSGVNTETVFAGMKAGVGKLAKAGEQIPETFTRIVDEITKMGPGSEATAKAIELFGQRAGPDLADAIAGGKFELDGMLDAIQGGSDTVAKAGADTADFSEKLLILKNQALVRLEPIALRVFGAIGDAVTLAVPYVTELAGGFRAMFGAFTDGGNEVTSSGIAGTMESIGIKLRDAFDRIAPLVGEFVDKIQSVDWAKVFGDVVAVVGPVVDAFVNLAVAVGEFAITHWPKVEALIPTLVTVFDLLGAATAIAVNFLADKMNILGPALVAVAAGFVAIKAAEMGAAKWTALKDAVGGASDKVKHLNSNFDKFLAKSKSAASAALDLGKKMVTTTVAIVKNSAAWVANKIAMAAAAVATAAQTIATTIATAATAAFNFVMALNPVVLVVLAIAALVAILVLAYFKVDWFREAVDKAFQVIRDVVVGAITWAKDRVLEAFDRIKNGISDAIAGAKLLVEIGMALVKARLIDPAVAAKDKVVEVFGLVRSGIGDAIDRAGQLVLDGMELVRSRLVDPVFAAKDKVFEVIEGIVSMFAGLPDRLLTGLSTLASKIAEPFKAMGDAIRKAWNDTIGGKGVDIPDVAGLPNRGERIEIPELHDGGPVTGRPGQEVLRILEAGEWVLSRAEVARMRSEGRSSPAGTAGVGAGFTIQNLEVTTVANANADEVVAGINAKLGWAHTARRDR